MDLFSFRLLMIKSSKPLKCPSRKNLTTLSRSYFFIIVDSSRLKNHANLIRSKEIMMINSENSSVAIIGTIRVLQIVTM